VNEAPGFYMIKGTKRKKMLLNYVTSLNFCLKNIDEKFSNALENATN
jgi:hypothetical protein